jgi:hypothetical protein
MIYKAQSGSFPAPFRVLSPGKDPVDQVVPVRDGGEDFVQRFLFSDH